MTKSFNFLLIILSFSLIQTALCEQIKNKQCLALSLRSGGDKGAYEAGALIHLFRTIPDLVQYDVVSGVSVGAINSLSVSLFQKGEERIAADFLEKTWMGLKRENLYKNWPYGGILRGFFDKESFFDTSPLRKFLKTQITHVKTMMKRNQAVQRNLTIGATDAQNVLYKTFNETLEEDDLITATMASSAIPALFPFIKFQNSSYVDGGVMQNLDIYNAIQRCKNIVEDEKNIVIDIILPINRKIEKIEYKQFNAIKALFRFRSINAYKNTLNELITQIRAFPKVNFRMIIMPSKNLPFEIIPIILDQKKKIEMMNLGRTDAQKAIEKLQKQKKTQNFEKLIRKIKSGYN